MTKHKDTCDTEKYDSPMARCNCGAWAQDDKDDSMYLSRLHLSFQRKIEALEAEVASLKAELDERRLDVADAVDNYDEQLTAVRRERDAFAASEHGSRMEIDALKAQLSAAREALEKIRDYTLSGHSFTKEGAICHVASAALASGKEPGNG